MTDQLKEKLESNLTEALDEFPELDFGGSMRRKDRLAFRLKHSKRDEFSEWSHWLSEDQLRSGPIREEIRRLMESKSWPESEYSPSVLSDSEYVQPKFEQLVEVIHRVSQDPRFAKLTVVLAAPDGDIEFLEVKDGDSFLSQLGESVGSGFLALGLLAWQDDGSGMEARKLLFRWHTDERLKALFDKICEAGVE